MLDAQERILRQPKVARMGKFVLPGYLALDGRSANLHSSDAEGLLGWRMRTGGWATQSTMVCLGRTLLSEDTCDAGSCGFSSSCCLRFHPARFSSGPIHEERSEERR